MKVKTFLKRTIFALLLLSGVCLSSCNASPISPTKTINSISVSDKAKFYDDKSFIDQTEITFVCNYKDGEQETIAKDKLTFIIKDTSYISYSIDQKLVIGKYNITASYQSWSYPYSITVYSKEAILDSISVARKDTSKTYFTNSDIPKEDLIVTAKYTDSTSKEVKDYSIDASQSQYEGKQTVFISYTEKDITKKTDFDVTFVAPKLDSISATYDGVVNVGGKLDEDSLIVTATYENGYTKEVTNYTYSGFSSKTAGNVTVKISYSEKGITAKTTVVITVKQLQYKDLEASFINENKPLFEALSHADFLVYIIYDNDSREKVDTFTIGNYDKTITTEQNVDISYTYLGTTKTKKTLVKFNEIVLKSISFDDEYEIRAGSKKTITVSYNPYNASYQDLSWESSDSNIAIVDQYGNVAVKDDATVGEKVTITAKSVKYPSITKSATIKVLDKSSLVKTKMAYNMEDYMEENLYKIKGTPNNGKARFLIIPVWFSDSDSYIDLDKRDDVRDDISLSYFGSRDEIGYESVKSYYEELSQGNIIFDGVVSSWYETSYTSYQFGQNNSVMDRIFEDSVTWYFNNTTETHCDFDCDGDGYLDGVVYIYAAPDYQNLYDMGDNAWAATYWCQTSANKTNPVRNVHFWASYDFMYGKDDAYDKTGSSYSNGDTRYCLVDSHTFIHETGHMLGYSDYYDYNGIADPAGGFSMQDYNVGSHDPFSVVSSGWCDPIIPTGSCEMTIGTFQATRDLILLTPEWNSIDSPFDEYMLLELYSPTGLNKFDSDHTYEYSYPKGPSTLGISLWNVDARLVYGYTPSASKITVNPNKGNVQFMMSNTYGSGPYISPLGTNYSEYNLLQLIRNDVNDTYRPKYSISDDDLFTQGSSFDFETYAGQFYLSTLNNGKDLGWSFEITNINSSIGEATIKLTRN